MASLTTIQIPPTEDQILSQLYLALLGEECIYMRLKVSGLEFRILEESTKYLSFEMTLIMEKIADMASYVRFIEIFKRKRTPSDSFDECSYDISKHNTTLENDSIKKAISESIFNDYKLYQNTVDQMRMNHICSNGKQQRTLHEVIEFALIWYKRLRYTKSFLINLFELKSGMEFLNYIFIEWELNCSKNWESSLLEHALYNGSVALSVICTNWLLDAQLDSNTEWMIKAKNSGNNTSTRDSTISHGTSYNSINMLLDFNDFNQKEVELTAETLLDDELTPLAIRQNPEVARLILEIGKKVHSIKVMRSMRTYEFEYEQRRKILLDLLKPEVWFNPAGSALLGIALNKLHNIVNEDMRCELMHRQRLVDHLTLVHTYFFMLRGDLFAELEQIMLVNFIKSMAHYYQTPISVRKRTSNSSKMTELLMNEALGKCSPPSNCADLMHILSSDKTPRDRSKTFYESFGIAYDAKWNNKNENQAFQKAIAFVFNKDVLKIYKKVFKTLVNFQMLRFQLDEIALRFTHKICPKLRRGKKNKSVPFFVHYNLQKVRLCLSRFANYIFEDVLLKETASILSSVKKEMNFQAVMLNRIVKAFGLCRESKQLFDPIMATIKAARNFVNSVEDFCDAMDARDDQKQQQQSPQLLRTRTSVLQNQMQNELNVATLGKPKAMILSDEFDKIESQQFALLHYIGQFQKSYTTLCTVVSQYLTEDDVSKKQSMYWTKLYTILTHSN